MSDDLDPTLKAELAALRSDEEPARDLWPGIEAGLDAPAPRRRWVLPVVLTGLGAGALAVVALLLVVGIGLATQGETLVATLVGDEVLAGSATAPDDLVFERLPTDGPLALGYGALQEGDLPRASVAFEAAVEADPDDPQALVAAAYTRLLQGDTDGADQALAAAESHARPEARGPIRVRRALVALQEGDLSDVQRHGEESGHPAGLVLAAEVYLADAEADAARPLLRRAAASEDPAVASAAHVYLDHLADTETGRQLLAEASALWALGQRADAVEVAEELLVFLPPSLETRDELLLMWAGRAATVGAPGTAERLLDEMGGVPSEQRWRVPGTRALVHAARGEHKDALEIIDLLDRGGAPADGLRDLRLTAAMVSDDAGFTEAVLAGVEGPGAALASGDPSRAAYADTPLATWVRER